MATMRKRLFKTVVTPEGVYFYDLDDEGKQSSLLLSIEYDKVHAKSKSFVMGYGIKQWVSDGSAMEEGATKEMRLAGMQERVDRLYNGTAEARVAGVRIPDAYIWEAVVGCGFIDDTEENIAVWKSMSAEDRRSLLEKDEVREYINAHRSESNADDILGKFKKS